MKALRTLRLPLIVILGIILAYVVIQFAVQSRQRALVTLLDNQFAQVVSVARQTGDTLSRLGADTSVDAIVANCPPSDLAQYNSLMTRLNDGLLQSELRDLSILFGRCGYRNFQRRAILTVSLEYHVAELTRISDVLRLFPEARRTAREVDRWQELVTAEQDLTLQFRRMTELQDEIIQTLLLGATITSPEIEKILFDVRQTRDAMTVRHLQLDDLRQELLSV